MSALPLVSTKPYIVVENFLHSKAEMAGWMLTTVCKQAYECHSVGACNVMTIGTEKDSIPGLLAVCSKA